MWTLLALGTFWFWTLLVIASIIIIACLENDSGTGATVTMGVFLVLFFFFGGRDAMEAVFSFIQTSPSKTIGILFIYFLAGTVYSFVKWYFYLLDAKERGVRKDSYQVQASENKGRIISWMSYWPLSLAWTFLDQPVKRLFTWIYNRTSKVYDRIHDHVFGS
jgi:hypothetical protein